MPRRRFKAERDKFLQREEVRRLLNGPLQAGSLRDYYLLSLMYYLALRSAEVVTLRPEYFNFHGKEVVIASAKRTPRKGQAFCAESGRARPMIRVPMLLGEAVMQSAADWAGAHSASGWMFPSRFDEGHPIKPRQVRATFRQWARSAGISDEVSSHSLRHSAGTHVYELAGARIRQTGADPVLLIRDFMRHANVATTSVYLHSADGTIQAARDALRGS